jgi:hypothetical protein
VELFKAEATSFFAGKQAFLNRFYELRALQ